MDTTKVPESDTSHHSRLQEHLFALLISGTSACAILLGISSSLAQSPTGTVRHHRVEEKDPAAALLSEAEDDIEKQNYVAAEPLLKKYLEAQPDDYSGWYYLGFAYRGLDRREDSIAAYRKSVTLKPDVFESNLNLGLALAATGNAEAERFLQTATMLKPTSSGEAEGHKRAWMALGRLLQTSKPEEAVRAFQEAAALDLKDPEPHLAAGNILEKQHSSEAEKEYQQALAAAPDSADSTAALANLYLQQHRFADAEVMLRKMTTSRPNDASAHLELGRLLAISGKNDEAVAELETGLKLEPADSKAQHDLANAYTSLGKYDLAEKTYLALLNGSPNNAGLHHSYGQALLKQRRFADAERELMKASELQPDGAAYSDLAIAANENKDYATAIKAIDLRARYLPEIPMSYFLRATAYDHLHDVKQAARYYHQFLEAAAGKYPEQEWQAKHRLIAIEAKR